jgi:hypothetical protein
MSNSMKIHLVGAEFFHAERWTDRQIERQTVMMKIIVAFCKSAKEPIQIQTEK